MIYQLAEWHSCWDLKIRSESVRVFHAWNGFDPLKKGHCSPLAGSNVYGHLKWRDKRQRCSGLTVLDSQKNWNWAAVDNMRLTISPHHFHSNHWYHRVRISSFVHSITRSRSLTTQVCFHAPRCGREITRLPALASTIFIHLKSASENDSTRYQEVYCS